MRLSCVRLTGKIIARLTSTNWGARLIRSAGVAQRALDWSVGFRRPYPSLEAARSAAFTYLPFDHSHPDNARLHLGLSDQLRPSDYPVLFHLGKLVKVRAIFDLGGNVGNLFYSYRNQLSCLSETHWRVYDVASIISLGQSLAKERNETRISFSSELEIPPDTDVLLASGSLHYFDESVANIIARQSQRPAHVFVNRTPLLDSKSAYTVQDAGSYLAACKLHARDVLITEMKALGYKCIDQWPVFELKLVIPCHPELSTPLYSGLYFRLQPVGLQGI